MTNQEAIDILKCDISADKQGIEYCHDEVGIKALDMAIKALEQEPSGDVISREPFTDSTICEGFSCDECSFNRKDKGGCILEERVKALPSIQPKPKTEQEDDYFRKMAGVVISQLRADRDRLEDELAKREQEPCKVSEYDKDHIWYKGCQYISLRRFLEVKAETEQEPSGDLISRQAVFEQINCWIGSGEYRYTNATHYLTERVKQLSSVKQEPKTGHWSHDGSHWKNRFICSECGYKLFDEPTNFCPNCGCRMVEPQESEK